MVLLYFALHGACTTTSTGQSHTGFTATPDAEVQPHLSRAIHRTWFATLSPAFMKKSCFEAKLLRRKTFVQQSSASAEILGFRRGNSIDGYVAA